MTSIAHDGAPPRPVALSLVAGLQSRWLWCFAAVAFVLLQDRQAIWDLARLLGDTDDATRLVQVRALLAGAGWYDLTLPQFGGASPLISHWSRLIDLPLVLLIRGFSLVVSPATAELMARGVWPLLLMLVLFRALAAEAEARGGRTAAWIALWLAATTVSGLFQFRPGRIDHHNAMILLTVAGLLLLARSLADGRRAGWAGALLGLALVVGYEPLALIVPLLAAAVLVAVGDADRLKVMSNAACGLAATMTAGLLLAVAPRDWGAPVCDALALNLVAAVAIGAMGLAEIAHQAARMTWRTQLFALAVTGALAGCVYVAANPTCLAGPFGAVSAATQANWLAHVAEAKPLLSMWPSTPLLVLVFGTFVLAGLVAAAWRWRQERSHDAAAMGVLLVAAVAVGLWQAKFAPYASFVAVLALAVALARVKARGALTPLSLQLAVLMVINQGTLFSAAGGLLRLIGTQPSAIAGETLRTTTKCFDIASVAALAQLPRGFMITGIDLAPHIAATTTHRVYAAPYHRLDTAIATTIRVYAAPAETAHRMLQELGADYVANCMPSPAAEKDASLPVWAPPDSFYARLAGGPALPFLVEVPNASPEPAIRVWRVVKP